MAVSPPDRRVDRAAITSGCTLLLLCAAAVLLPLRYRWLGTGGMLSQGVYWGLILILAATGIQQIANAIVPPARKRRLPSLNRYRVRFPREGLIYLAIMVVLFIGSLLGRENRLMLVFAMMAGPFVINGWATFTMLQASGVARSGPCRAMAGELFAVEIAFTNLRPFFSAWMMLVQDELTRDDDEVVVASVLFTHVSPHERQVGHYEARLYRRGRYRLGPLTVGSRFPLGLIERARVFPSRDEILIYPRLGRLRSGWQRELLHASELVTIPQSRAGLYDDEFHRLREYRPGDNPRAIHWRSSARRNELILREYHQSREHNLLIVLDLWAPAVPTAAEVDRVEWALSLAGTLCLEHRRASRESSIRLLASARQQRSWEGQASAASLEELFDVLAILEAGAGDFPESLALEALQHAGPADRILCLSTRPSSDADRATALPVSDPRAQVVYVDPATVRKWLVFDDDDSGPTAGATAPAVVADAPAAAAVPGGT